MTPRFELHLAYVSTCRTRPICRFSFGFCNFIYRIVSPHFTQNHPDKGKNKGKLLCAAQQESIFGAQFFGGIPLLLPQTVDGNNIAYTRGGRNTFLTIGR